MHIDWWTFTLQTINFLVLVWLLWRFLYKPAKEVIEKRKQLAEQAFADADKQKGEAEAARQRFEEGRDGLVQERQDILKKVHREVEDEHSKILDEARQEADRLIEAARDTIADEREAVSGEIREQVAGLAVELASKFLRKAGSDVSNDVFLEQLEKLLNELPDTERDRLRKDLADDNAHLTVVTAEPLARKDQERWTNRLNACLGQKDKTDFTIDPGILGGAELHLPHAVLKLTWADQLEKAKELLGQNESAS